MATAPKELLETEVIPELKAKSTLLVFCTAGHGRTGTFLASLIALLEPEIEDPVAEIRSRYCHHAVETPEQIEAIFALRGQPVPNQYKKKRGFF